MIDRSPSAPLSPERLTAAAIARTISVAIAVVALLGLAAFPGVLMRGDALLTQALLPFLLAGVAACIAHGLGWRPRSSVFAAASGPLVAWPLTLAVFAFLALGAGVTAV